MPIPCPLVGVEREEEAALHRSSYCASLQAGTKVEASPARSLLAACFHIIALIFVPSKRPPSRTFGAKSIMVEAKERAIVDALETGDAWTLRELALCPGGLLNGECGVAVCPNCCRGCMYDDTYCYQYAPRYIHPLYSQASSHMKTPVGSRTNRHRFAPTTSMASPCGCDDIIKPATTT